MGLTQQEAEAADFRKTSESCRDIWTSMMQSICDNSTTPVGSDNAKVAMVLLEALKSIDEHLVEIRIAVKSNNGPLAG